MDTLAFDAAPMLTLNAGATATAGPAETHEPAPGEAVVSRVADFWLLGGASIALWGVLQLAQLVREGNGAIESHFVQLGALFSLLAIVCNHPHFMISYRFGYGQGIRFVLRHWPSLLLMPLALLAFYAFAFARFESPLGTLPGIAFLNEVFARAGLGLRLGSLPNLGTEFLSLSVLLMNIAVGWHYSKQVFGCQMVYARYDRYPLRLPQRTLLKASLFSVAFFNFFYMAIYAPEYNGHSGTKSYFFNIPVVSLGLPPVLIPLSALAVAASAASLLYFVVYRNYREHRRLPHVNLVVPWLAFHFWWIPLFRQNEFYFMAVPFFHSLQYLPFAARRARGRASLPAAVRSEVGRALKIALLLLIGFAAFEWVPAVLDTRFDTIFFLKTWFFMVTFVVFINIHHFFIDSVVWKLGERPVSEGLFAGPAGPPRPENSP